MTTPDSSVPEGFLPMPIKGGFIEHNGPLFVKTAEPGEYVLGFRVEAQHCNPHGTCHGGCLSFFADIQLAGISYQHRGSDRGIATISLTVDYLSAVQLGQWVEGKAEVVRVTRNLIFTQMIATADGKPCLRANGIFKV